jgi:hypothetical protein
MAGSRVFSAEALHPRSPLKSYRMRVIDQVPFSPRWLVEVPDMTLRLDACPSSTLTKWN